VNEFRFVSRSKTRRNSVHNAAHMRLDDIDQAEEKTEIYDIKCSNAQFNAIFNFRNIFYFIDI